MLIAVFSALTLVAQVQAHASDQVIGLREWRELACADGVVLRYAVVLPADFDARQPHPVLLALPGGKQDRAQVENNLDTYWQSPAIARGWVVVSPIAPGEKLFFQGGEVLLPPLLDAIERGFVLEGGRVHLAGISNGGLSAFRIATQQAQRFASLTVCPGYAPQDADFARLDALIEMPIAMFAGGADADWVQSMQRTQSRLRELGAPAVELTVFPGEDHRPASADGARLFTQLEEFRALALERARAESAVRAALDDFHLAASQADGPRYFAHFTADATYIGTDATERWSLAEFRAYAMPYFSAGKGWTYTPTERHVGLSFDRRTAWFDERLSNAKYGEVRGSGVLRKQGQEWRIAQYVLSFAVPNELSSELVERIRKAPRGR
jgi:pimeloyl-ACP methyl ester carboxylesterase